MGFGKKIKKARVERGLNQLALASYIERGQSSVSQWENDTVSISADDLYLIAKATQKPINWFFEDEETLPASSNAKETFAEHVKFVEPSHIERMESMEEQNSMILSAIQQQTETLKLIAESIQNLEKKEDENIILAQQCTEMARQSVVLTEQNEQLIAKLVQTGIAEISVLDQKQIKGKNV